MRRTVSSTLAVVAAFAVFAALVGVGMVGFGSVFKTVASLAGTTIVHAGLDARAQTRDDAGAGTEEEEGKSGDEDKEKKSKGVSIHIDESGIRIQGGEGEADSSSDRIIFGSRYGETRRFKEKGADIVRFGEDVSVDADELVRGDVVVFGGDVSVAGKVVGNVVVLMGDASVASGAEISGDLVVVGGTLDEQPEVIIHGERVVVKNFDFSMKAFPFGFWRHPRPFDFFSTTAKFFVSVVLAFLVILFLRGRVVRSHEQIVSNVPKSFGAGFLVAFIAVFVVPVLLFILFVTIIGIPLALVLLAGCLAAYFVARTVFAYALGAKVTEKLNLQTTNPFAIVLVGMAVLYLPALLGFGFSLIPFAGALGGFFKVIGILFGIFAFLAGLGALFLTRFGNRGAPVPAVVPGQVPPQ